MTTTTLDLRETTLEGVPLLVSKGAERFGARLVFTDRRGGVSEGEFASLNLSESVGDDAGAVGRNRARLASAAGFEPSKLASLRQVHGATVVEADASTCGILGDGDATVARKPGPILAILTADCVPVLLARKGVVAAVHAGWKGLVAGVVEQALDTMGGAEAAWVGPAIRACCYEVGAEVISGFRDRALPVGDGRVDPPIAATTLLERAGIASIAVSERCTHCDPDLFSFRRDGRTGRQGALIWLT